MKFPTWVVLAYALGALLSLNLSYPFVWPLSSHEQAMAAYVSDYMTELEAVPLYPNAQQVEVSKQTATDRVTSFVTPDEYAQVFAFYREILPKLGWAVKEDFRDSPNIVFTYRSQDVDIPWGLDLGIYVEVLIGGETKVYLRVERWPELDRLPLYERARQIEMHQEGGPGSDGSAVRITTYVADATPQDIENYYKAALPLHGWAFYQNSDPITQEPGILFTSIRHHIRVRNESFIEITATVVSKAQTRVILRVGGSYIESPLPLMPPETPSGPNSATPGMPRTGTDNDSNGNIMIAVVIVGALLNLIGLALICRSVDHPDGSKTRC